MHVVFCFVLSSSAHFIFDFPVLLIQDVVKFWREDEFMVVRCSRNDVLDTKLAPIPKRKFSSSMFPNRSMYRCPCVD